MPYYSAFDLSILDGIEGSVNKLSRLVDQGREKKDIEKAAFEEAALVVGLYRAASRDPHQVSLFSQYSINDVATSVRLHNTVH